MSIETGAVLSPPAVKETKAQKAERLKQAKNPWEAFDEVRRFAREGRASVLPEWASFYFKWWGIYTQGDGAGVTGGVGGEGKTTEYFMMRIGIPGGRATPAQMRVIAQVARAHGRNLADITTRQAIQLHWLTIESLPEVVDALDAVGLSPRSACGDVTRNVTCCPLAGIDKAELVDASQLALAISHELQGNEEFYNLPRKLKITATGCPVWCTYPEINEIGMTAVRRGDEVGYSVRVGGGLSNEPHLGIKLDAFVRQDQAVRVARGIAELFRSQDSLRESRERARLKYLFLREGWTAERFLSELESTIGFKLEPGVADEAPEDVFRDHVGVQPQKQPGLNSIGATVLRGRMTGEQLEGVADLAERLGAGEIRTTIMQNFILTGVPSAKTQDAVRGLNDLGLTVEASNFWRGTVACTGTEFCKLAITETKGFARWLVDEMETRMPGFDQQIKINVTGCPNNCGQAWIGDVGLEGKKIKLDGKLVDAWYFALGGALGKHAGLARQVNYRCASHDVPDALERLLSGYLKTREADENLRAWFARRSNDELRAVLASGVEVALAAQPA
ncbi:MAG: nitrite/sulfite reductase [Terracidiphilus sp.]